MSYIIAIDVGIKNLGLCVFDFTTSKVVHWDNVTLVHNGRYLPANNVQYVRDFIANQSLYFTNAFMVLVERQIRCNMRIIEAVIQALFFERCLISSARSAKMHYGLSTKSYRQTNSVLSSGHRNSLAPRHKCLQMAQKQHSAIAKS